MRVSGIQSTNNQNFKRIYLRNKNLSKEQKQVAVLIKNILKRQTESNESLIKKYEKLNLDFFIKPIGKDLISLDAASKFSFLRWLFQKDYSGNETINIGIYNKEATKFLEADLEKQYTSLKIMSL